MIKTPSQLNWQCRRGNKELDLMLTAFMQKYYDNASEDEITALEFLLEQSDPELWLLIVGLKQSSNYHVQQLIEKIRTLTPV